MQKKDCFFTKYCFLTSFLIVSAVWSIISYNPLYESSKLNFSINAIGNYLTYAVNSELDIDIENIKKFLNSACSENKSLSISFIKYHSPEPYEIIYKNNEIKKHWYKKTSKRYGIFRRLKNADEYEYVIYGQYKYILPVALIRLWSFSIIPDIFEHKINDFNFTTQKKYIWQSCCFWMIVICLREILLIFKYSVKR